jgi:hypothetical protein
MRSRGVGLEVLRGTQGDTAPARLSRRQVLIQSINNDAPQALDAVLEYGLVMVYAARRHGRYTASWSQRDPSRASSPWSRRTQSRGRAAGLCGAPTPSCHVQKVLHTPLVPLLFPRPPRPQMPQSRLRPLQLPFPVFLSRTRWMRSGSPRLLREK